MSVNNLGSSTGSYSKPPERVEKERKEKEDTKRTTGGNSLSLDDFYQLMAVQLQNQDMSSPMDNSEMMNQMVQMAMVEAMSTFTDLSVTTYATNLLGQQVEVFDVVDGKNVTKVGTVTGVNLSGDVRIYLDGDSKAYGIGNVMHVGEIPPEEEEKEDGGDDKTEDPGGTEKPGGSEGSGGTEGPGGSEGSGGTGGPGSSEGPGGSGSSEDSDRASRASSGTGRASSPSDGANAAPGTGNKPGPDDHDTLDSPDINAITRMV